MLRFYIITSELLIYLKKYQKQQIHFEKESHFNFIDKCATEVLLKEDIITIGLSFFSLIIP